MTLPVSGPLSLNAVNVELGLSGTTLISLNQASVRTLAGVPSGVISMSNLYGKSNRVTAVYNITSNLLSQFSLNINAVSGYVAGVTDVIINVSAGVYVAAPGTSSVAIYITSGNVGDTVTINNSGYILGAGGAGGIGRNSSPGTGGNGSSAIVFQFSPVALTVNNAVGAYICGGGGGGGGGTWGGGGGGAGGGTGGNAFDGATTYIGGSGGGIGASGTNGGNGTFPNNYYAGGGGGRVIPSTQTTNPLSAVGLGGSGGGVGGGTVDGVLGTLPGGYGGGPGQAGTTGIYAQTGGGGGGWGANGASGGGSGAAGGNAGNAIIKPTGAYVLNNSGAIYGPIV